MEKIVSADLYDAVVKADTEPVPDLPRLETLAAERLPWDAQATDRQ